MSEATAPPRKFAVVAAFAALYLIWGSTYLGIRFAIDSIPPLLMAGTRFFLAGIIMFGIARWQGAPRSSFAEWRTALIVGTCLLFFGNGSVTVAEQWVATGLASLLVATVPIYIALLAWLTGSAPRPRPLVLLGLAGGFVGVGILVGPALTTTPAGGSQHLGFGNVDSAFRFAPLVDWLALFAPRTQFRFALSFLRANDALRRRAHDDRRTLRTAKRGPSISVR